MTPSGLRGFRDGYLEKTADAGGIGNLIGGVGEALKSGVDTVGTLAGKATDLLVPAALLAPIGVGAAAGMGVSKLTSPTPTDQQSAEEAIELEETRQFNAELRRRKALAELAAKREAADERTLHLS